MENNFFSEGGAKFEGHGFATAAGRGREKRDKEQQTGQLLLTLLKTRDKVHWTLPSLSLKEKHRYRHHQSHMYNVLQDTSLTVFALH